MAKFNYILNDLALINLVTRNLYSKNVCREDKEELKNQIKLIMQENQQLKDNWNKLKEYIKETKLKEFEKSYGKRYDKTFTQAEIIVCNMILDKMQELAKGDSNGQ